MWAQIHIKSTILDIGEDEHDHRWRYLIPFLYLACLVL